MAVNRQQYINASGSQTQFIVTVTAQLIAVTIGNDDRFVYYTGTGDAVPTFDLPSHPYVGEIHYVGDDSGNISATNTLTISASPNTIEGFATYVVFSPKKKVGLVWQGTQWAVIATTPPLTVAEGGALIDRVTWGIMFGVASSTVGSSTPQIIGGTYLDLTAMNPSGPTLTTEVFFKVLLQTTNASNVANIDLIDPNNVLGNGLGAEVPGSLITTTALTPTYTSVRVTALENPFSPIVGVFQARIWVNPQAAGQQVTCQMAKIDVEMH